MGRTRSPDLVPAVLGQEIQNYPFNSMVVEMPETGLDDNSTTNEIFLWRAGSPPYGNMGNWILVGRAPCPAGRTTRDTVS